MALHKHALHTRTRDGRSESRSATMRRYTRLYVGGNSYAERNAGRDRFNLESLGVPAQESGIRW